MACCVLHNICEAKGNTSIVSGYRTDLFLKACTDNQIPSTCTQLLVPSRPGKFVMLCAHISRNSEEPEGDLDCAKSCYCGVMVLKEKLNRTLPHTSVLTSLDGF